MNELDFKSSTIHRYFAVDPAGLLLPYPSVHADAQPCENCLILAVQDTEHRLRSQRLGCLATSPQTSLILHTLL
jgi:hypothetical protein